MYTDRRRCRYNIIMYLHNIAVVLYINIYIGICAGCGGGILSVGSRAYRKVHRGDVPAR